MNKFSQYFYKKLLQNATTKIDHFIDNPKAIT